MKIDRVVLVGLGGIGSLVVEPLARLLAWHEHGTRELTFIDGDKYESGNRTRQMFAAGLTGENKARVAAMRIARDLDGATAPEPREEYATEDTFSDVFDRGGHTLVVLAVDNHATHAACLAALADAVERDKRSGVPRDATVLRPGNGGGEAWGRVTMSSHVVRRGVPLTVDPRETHGEVGTPPDHIPGQGCAVLTPDEPQKLAANMLAAALTVAYVSAILDGRAFPDEWHGELGEDVPERVRWRGGPAGPFIGGVAKRDHPSPQSKLARGVAAVAIALELGTLDGATPPAS